MTTGTIFLVGTPIGNLEDMTFRAVRTLHAVDIIAAEDTRHTQILLTHYNIRTPLTSYYEYNERQKAAFLVREAKAGKNVAVVSNAGMPGISDPGYRVVQEAIKEDVRLEVIPGASSILSALVLSGLPTDRFVFEGFLSAKEVARKKHLYELSREERTVVLMESAQRLKALLSDILEVLGDVPAVLARELTKIHESVIRKTVRELIALIDEKDLKGECVLLISPKGCPAYSEAASPEELVEQIEKKMGISRMEAIKIAARTLGVGKSEVYKKVHAHKVKKK